MIFFSTLTDYTNDRREKYECSHKKVLYIKYNFLSEDKFLILGFKII